MSLLSSLPKPVPSLYSSKWNTEPEEPAKSAKTSKQRQQDPQKHFLVPKYGQRSSFLPTMNEHFGNGGAFPEIRAVQFPLSMGRRKAEGAETHDTLSLAITRDGRINFDAVVQSKRIVHSKMNDMIAQDIRIDDPALIRPSQDQIDNTTKTTKEALEKLVEGRLKTGRTKNISKDGSSYVRYQSAESQQDSNSISSTRIIKLVSAPIDPLEPSRFKHRKVPRAPGSPPAPVLQSPPRKVSVEEQKNWVIPPCISNWKNAKGYTIPLDKRLANDGRGLQDVSINDNFAKISEALFVADRHAREEVKLRGEMYVKLAEKEKRDREEKLREMAQKARDERGGTNTAATVSRVIDSDTDSDRDQRQRPRDDQHSLSRHEQDKLRERQELRVEKQRQREQNLRTSHKQGGKTGERDISEKIALGIAKPSATGESMYDQRLFNQTSGMNAGFGGDDSYNLYDKPLFSGSSANTIYRPKQFGAGAGDEDVDKITRIVGQQQSRGFQGTEGGDSRTARDGPVVFEKEDVFGVGAFMDAAKRAGDNTSSSADQKRQRK